MKAELRVEIFAMAIGSTGSNGVGAVEHLLEITTETSILHLPIQASILITHNTIAHLENKIMWNHMLFGGSNHRVVFKFLTFPLVVPYPSCSCVNSRVL